MRYGLILAFAFLCFEAKAQTTSPLAVNFPPADSSPVDMVYYPLNAPKAKDPDSAKAKIKVIYARPQKKGREIFGVLEQYGKVWRFGANESTEIKFFDKAYINGKKIKAGSYSLFAIPNKNSWTIILNSQTDRWGAFTYDPTKDVLRVEVPVKTLTKPVEYFSITFADVANTVVLVAAWDKVQVEVPITF